MNLFPNVRFIGLLFWVAPAVCLNATEPAGLVASADSEPQRRLTAPQTDIWQAGVGEGFRRGTQTLSLEAGGAAGVAAFGSRQAHDLALMSLSYGWMLGNVQAENHWWRGNWEFRVELFGGAEFSPDNEWLVGLTPHLRYNFATGSRWIPFVGGGAGVTGTGIGRPDLSTTFEFNLQGGVGLHWFFRDNLALTGEARYLHISNAGIKHPNDGLNAVMGMVGVTWFF